MPQLTTLTVAVLRELLREFELDTSGVKTVLVTRLTEHLGSDEIDEATLNRVAPSGISVLQAQINQLTETMNTLMAAVNTNRDATLRENTDTNRPRISDDNPTLSRRSSGHSMLTAIHHQDNAATVHSVRDVAAVLPEFDPGKNQHTSRQFIQKIESLMEAYGWHENVVLYAVQGKLRGHAKTWMDAQPVYTRWQSFVDAFLDDFPTLVNTADIHIEMMRNRQQKNESVTDFYYKMLSLGRLGKFDDKSIIRHVTNGLHDERVRQTLNVMQFVTCSEFLRALNGIALTNKTQRAEQTNYFQNRSKEVNTVLPKTKTPRQDAGVPICYNCRESNHISVNCPKPQKRNRCPSCTKVHPVGAPADCGKKPVSSRVVIGDHVFTKNVMINGSSFQAFADTGSQCSMIRRTVVNMIGGNLEPCTLTIRGIGGGTETVKESVNLVVRVDDENVAVKLYVVEDHVFQENLLLGQNVFEKSEIKALVENGTLE